MPAARKAVNIGDLQKLARRRLPEFVFLPMDRGVGDGSGPTHNMAQLAKQKLLPRVLGTEAQVSQSVTVFGRTYASAFGVSAVGGADNFRRGADGFLAHAAEAANIPFMLSGCSSATLEEIVRICPAQLWSQLYAARDRTLTDRMIGRAADCGVETLVVTVDVPVRARVDFLARRGISLPASVAARSWLYVMGQLLAHLAWSVEYVSHGAPPMLRSWQAFAPPGASATAVARRFAEQVPSALSWTEIERIRRLWPGNLVLKGIMHPDDALRAAELGADAVTVSNHGGNKIDSAAAPIEALPGVKAALAGRIPVFFDGGIRRGVDLAAAYCLGADFCFVGRATLYGAVAGGQAGAHRAVAILREELQEALALIGAAAISDLDASRIAPVN